MVSSEMSPLAESAFSSVCVSVLVCVCVSMCVFVWVCVFVCVRMNVCGHLSQYFLHIVYVANPLRTALAL